MKKKMLSVILIVTIAISVLGFQAIAFGENPTASAQPNLIRNGEFDKNMAGWTSQVHDSHGANARISIVKEDGMSGAKTAKIAIKNPGSETWEIELFTSLAVKKGKTYQVTFMAKGVSNCPITVMFQQNVTPWQPYFSQVVNISTKPDIYTFTWKSEVNDPDIRLNFNFGACEADVWLDNVQVVQLD